MEKPIRLAVYGTLRQGFGNNGYLRNSEFVGQGKTTEKYAMYASGIPFVTKKNAHTNIVVEVFEVNDENTLRHVDSLEGHPDWYKREPIEVTLEDGTKTIAELYFCDDISQNSNQLVESGDYASR